MVRLTRLRTLNAFRLLQLTRIYDLNFIPSLRMVFERRVIEQLTASLPRTDELSRFMDNLRTYVNERLERLPPRERRAKGLPAPVKTTFALNSPCCSAMMLGLEEAHAKG